MAQAEKKKLIVVSGITGNQGCGVARGLFERANFRLRGLARSFSQEEDRKIRDHGVEPFVADYYNPSSLRNALRGADGAFLVTQFFEKEAMTEDKEFEQGKNFIDAAVAEGVKYIVFSSLDFAWEKAHLKVPHFDAKGRIEKYLQHSGLQWTIVRYAYYFENFLTQPKKENGRYVIKMPLGSSPLFSIAVEDGGHVVSHIFENCEQWKGKSVGLATERLNVAEYCKILTKVLGKEIAYQPVSYEEYKNLCPETGDCLAQMFKFYAEHQDKLSYDVNATKKIHQNTMSFEHWAEKNKARFQLA